jgi:hypothetical protein
MVGGDVQVLLADPAAAGEPPAPWLDEGTQWTLPAYLPAPVTGADSPLPMLATIGSRAGRHLLIDLHRLGTLSVRGHPDRVRDLLRHLACELACNTWTDEATVLLVGFGDDTDTFSEIGPDRIRTAPTMVGGITAIRSELGQPPAPGRGMMLLLVADSDPRHHAELVELHHDISRAGRPGICVIAAVADTPIGPAVLTVTDAGTLTADLPGLRQTTDAAQVPADMLEPMATVFRVAHLTPSQTSTMDPNLVAPEWDDTIDPTAGVLALFDSVPGDVDELDTDLADWNDPSTSRPRIGILGPIEVHMPGPVASSRHRLYTEMLLFLLTRPHRTATPAAIEDALWYGHSAGEGTIRKSISFIRRWLGPRADGDDWIPDLDADGVYRLRGGVLFDWHLLQRLRERGAARGGADAIADYRAALTLVRGVPMPDLPDQNPYRRPYTWIGSSDIAPGRLIATVTDLAHQVAVHHLGIGDPATARWAVSQAWIVDPDRSGDDLWHDLMRVEHAEGHTATLNQLVTEYLAARDAEVLEDLPTPTYNLIRGLVEP